MTAFFEFITEENVITIQEVHIGEKVSEGRKCIKVQCDGDELIHALNILNIPQIPERVFTFWTSNANSIYKSWNNKKDKLESIEKTLDELGVLRKKLENLIKDFTWQELAAIPRLEAKACAAYKKENNCGLYTSYQAVREYIDSRKKSDV